MYNTLIDINNRPQPWEFYTAETLWTDPHTASHMLTYHLNEQLDAASRNHPFIQKSISWLIDQFSIGNNTQIADFGCGPGMYTLPLARTGARVTGIDFSENSLGHARNQAAQEELDIDYIRCNYLEYDTDTRFDIIIMIMCDFCALSPIQRKKLLDKFRSFLKPGGTVLLDVYTPAWYQQQQESAGYEYNHMNGFWSSEDYYSFFNVFKYDEERLVLNKYTVVEESRTRHIYNWLQAFSRESLQQEFEENGLNISDWYADVAGTRYNEENTEMAVVARLS